ncbi:hypothetical protein L1887_07258 [Cichorium endivia]|nr:hypothetical protein L1887_07258 [Cichorium endivia]
MVVSIWAGHSYPLIHYVALVLRLSFPSRLKRSIPDLASLIQKIRRNESTKIRLWSCRYDVIEKTQIPITFQGIFLFGATGPTFTRRDRSHLRRLHCVLPQFSR